MNNPYIATLLNLIIRPYYGFVLIVMGPLTRAQHDRR